MTYAGLTSRSRRSRWAVPCILSVAIATVDKTFSLVPPSRNVQVWDNVLAPQQCLDLHELATDHLSRVDDDENDSHIFCWNPLKERNEQSQLNVYTPLEFAIGSILQELGEEECIPTTGIPSKSTSYVIEYWTRQDYLDLEVHSDIDEGLDELRYPAFGHVLYLLAQREETEVDSSASYTSGAFKSGGENAGTAIVGPTCVFPDKLGGWNTTSSTGNGLMKVTHLVTVPVKSGRLLRFVGNAMHAVPKPLVRWFHSVDDQEEMVEDDDDEGLVRSVILFNVWHEQGPSSAHTIGQNYFMERNGRLPDGISLDDDDGQGDPIEHVAKPEVDRRLEQQQKWEQEFGSDYRTLRCRPRSKWNSVAIEDDSNVGNGYTPGTIQMALMGNARRRLNTQKYVKMQGNLAAIQDGLQDSMIPRSFRLTDENSA